MMSDVTYSTFGVTSRQTPPMASGRSKDPTVFGEGALAGWILFAASSEWCSFIDAYLTSNASDWPALS